MNRLLIVARLQDGKHAAAKNLLRQGPPFYWSREETKLGVGLGV